MKYFDKYVESLMEFHGELKRMIKRLDYLKKKVNDELDKDGRVLK